MRLTPFFMQTRMLSHIHTCWVSGLFGSSHGLMTVLGSLALHTWHILLYTQLPFLKVMSACTGILKLLRSTAEMQPYTGPRLFPIALPALLCTCWGISNDMRLFAVVSRHWGLLYLSTAALREQEGGLQTFSCGVQQPVHLLPAAGTCREGAGRRRGGHPPEACLGQAVSLSPYACSHLRCNFSFERLHATIGIREEEREGAC